MISLFVVRLRQKSLQVFFEVQVCPLADFVKSMIQGNCSYFQGFSEISWLHQKTHSFHKMLLKNYSNKRWNKKFKKSTGSSLVTQSMMQRRPNPTELRWMDSYIQILCKFQKCKQKVPPRPSVQECIENQSYVIKSAP